MINITSKGRYALKIMIDLALNEEHGKQQRLEIAQRQGIPPDYIDQILSRLRANGLIESIRGRYGGFLLALESEQISAWDIFAAVEDTIYPVRCMESSSCQSDQNCSTKGIWSDLFIDLEQSLKNKSLKHLVAVWKNSEDKAIMNLTSYSGPSNSPIGSSTKKIGECKAPVKRLGGRD